MKRFLAFFLFFICSMNVCAKEVEEPKELYANSAVLMDADSGRVLFEKNGYEKLPMASTTKIMTCILALENGNLKDKVTASKNAVSQPKVHLGMTEGEQFYLEDLLYSLMLESHNDSAVAIAEYLDGSVDAFANRMNKKAKELGCNDTYFITPNGLDAVDEIDSHSTTARDLARIMSYCIEESPKKEAFLSITSTPLFSFSNLAGSKTYSCTNHNTFLSMMDGAISGKTGFTGKAGYCYVGAVEREGRTFVVSLLACGWPNNKTYKWKDMRKLMEYAISNYHYKKVTDQIILPKVQLEEGVKEYITLNVDLKEEDNILLLMQETEKTEMKIIIDENLKAPIKKGDSVGKLVVLLEGEVMKTFPLISNESVERKTLKWYWVEITKLYLGIV